MGKKPILISITECMNLSGVFLTPFDLEFLQLFTALKKTCLSISYKSPITQMSWLNLNPSTYLRFLKWERLFALHLLQGILHLSYGPASDILESIPLNLFLARVLGLKWLLFLSNIIQW